MPDPLERSLRAAGRELDYPPTPDLAAAVAVALREGRGPRSTAPRWAALRRPALRVALVAALTVLVAAGTVLAASPGARDALRDLLGLRGATVEPVPTLPPAPDEGLRLGVSVSPAEARERVDFGVLGPPAGLPGRVRVSRAAPGGVVSFDLGRLRVTQFSGSVAREFLGKYVAEGTRVERLRVGGEPALWLDGMPHVVFVRDRSGRIVEHTLRRAGAVLLVQRGPLLIRVEGASTRAAAVALAGSLR